MLQTEELATLIRFRQELYDSLGLRQDSLFELVDAALTAGQRSTLVRLSLGWFDRCACHARSVYADASRLGRG